MTRSIDHIYIIILVWDFTNKLIESKSKEKQQKFYYTQLVTLVPQTMINVRHIKPNFQPKEQLLFILNIV